MKRKTIKQKWTRKITVRERYVLKQTKAHIKSIFYAKQQNIQ